VSAARETNPFANFGTADTAVAHFLNRLLGCENKLKLELQSSVFGSTEHWAESRF